MLQVKELTSIRSEAARWLHAFYRTQETNCERIALSRVKGSDVYIKLDLLTERVDRSAGKTDHANRENDEHADRQEKRVRGGAGAKSAEDFQQSGQQADDGKKKEDERYLLERQREPWGSVFRGNGQRLILTGEPGSGKSFSLSQEVRERLVRARIELEESRRPLSDLELPIVVKASALVASGSESVAEALFEAVRLPGAIPDYFREWWRSAFYHDQARRLFIVIDGLDELSDSQASQNRFRKLMTELHQFEAANLVVTCRTTSFEERQDWIGWLGDRRIKVAELAPLVDEQQTELLEKWVGRDDAARENLLTLLQSNYWVRHSCRQPLILTLVCGTYETLKRRSPSEINYALLYADVSKKILRGDGRDEPPQWMQPKSNVLREAARDDIITLLSRICWQLFQTAPSENRFTLTEWRQATDRTTRVNCPTIIDSPQLLSDLLLVGMVIDAGDSKQGSCFSFAHRTFLEYFAARGLVEEPEQEWVGTIVKHMWCESAWLELTRFAAGMTKHSGELLNPDELLNNVAREVGSASVPVCSLQVLSRSCGFVATMCFLALVVMSVIASLMIGTSPNAKAQMLDHVSNLARSLPPKSTVSFSAQTASVLLDKFLVLYNLTLQTLYEESLRNQGPMAKYMYPAVAWMQFLVPRLVVLLPVMLVGVVLAIFARKFFPLRIPRQDDVFRTGLRLLAEIIGQNRLASKMFCKRVVKQMLASELTKSANIHGATPDGGIPQDLLMLFGSNADAREMLNRKWLKTVNWRCWQLMSCNRVYGWTLSLLGWVFAALRPKDSALLLVKEDLGNGAWLIEELGPSGREPFSKTLRAMLSADMNSRLDQQSRAKDRSEGSTTNTKELLDALVRELNVVLEGPSLFEPAKFKHVTLRAETIALLSREPTDDHLIRLNRLLLEDAYYPRIRKRQNLWVRIASWCCWQFVKNNLGDSMSELRKLDRNSKLSLALRGLALIPDEHDSVGLREALLRLLKQSEIAGRFLVLAGRTRSSFTSLDVSCAQVLTSMHDSVGKERLVEFVVRLENNVDMPLAVKALSIADYRLGVEAVANCIKTDNKSDDDYASSRDHEFIAVLLGLRHGRVIKELSRLAVADQECFGKVFVPFLRRIDTATALEALQRMASDGESEALRTAARNLLNSPYTSDRAWLDGGGWLEDQAVGIRQSLAQGHIVAAIESLDSVLTSWWLDFRSDGVLLGLDKVAAVCDERVWNTWLDKHLTYFSPRKDIFAFLGSSPRIGILEEALSARARKMNFAHIDGEGFSEKTTLLRYLGELGTPKAGEVLLEILRGSRRPRSRIERFFTDNAYDTAWFYNRLLANLTKVGGDAVLKAILREARRHGYWVLFFVGARLLAERDAWEALKLLLKGMSRRGTGGWEDEFGDEPEPHALAMRCGARVSKVDHRGYWEYVVVSQSRDHKFRVRA